MFCLKRVCWIVLICTALIVVRAPSAAAQEPTPAEQPFIYGGLAWSPDGSQIAVGTSDGVWIHQADDLDNRQHTISVDFVTAMDWHPTENWIAVGNISPQGDELRIWDAGTGKVIQVLEGHNHRIGNVRWSADGTMLASRSWDKSVRIWDSASGEVLRIIPLPTHITWMAMEWSPDSCCVVVTNYTRQTEESVFIYDLSTGAVVQSWASIGSPPYLIWSPNGESISVLQDQLWVWDAETGEVLKSIDVGESTSFAGVWSPDAASIVLHLRVYDTHNHDRLVKVDLASGEVIAEATEAVEMRGDGFYANALAYSPDGTQIASISDDGRLLLFNSDDLTLLDSFDGYRSILLEDMDS
jgi:WD40 repeat protein